MLKKVWNFSRAKKRLFALKSGQNFCSGSPGVLQNFKNWLETVIVWREFRDYQVKLKLFVLKRGQNIRSENFKNLLKPVTVKKSLRNQIWKCHFCQNLGGLTANFTESEMVSKKLPKKRLKDWPWTLFFDKNIEKLRPSPDSLLMTVCKWRQILQNLKWFWNKVKISKEEVERMGMKNLFFGKNKEELRSNPNFLPLTSWKIWKNHG